MAVEYNTPGNFNISGNYKIDPLKGKKPKKKFPVVPFILFMLVIIAALIFLIPFSGDLIAQKRLDDYTTKALQIKEKLTNEILLAKDAGYSEQPVNLYFAAEKNEGGWARVTGGGFGSSIIGSEYLSNFLNKLAPDAKIGAKLVVYVKKEGGQTFCSGAAYSEDIKSVISNSTLGAIGSEKTPVISKIGDLKGTHKNGVVVGVTGGV
jgi:hypothetical protein